MEGPSLTGPLSGALMLLQNAGSQFFRKTLKLFRSDLERTSKDTTRNSKNGQLMNNKFPHGAVFIRHRIRVQQSGFCGAGQAVARSTIERKETASMNLFRSTSAGGVMQTMGSGSRRLRPTGRFGAALLILAA